MTASLTFQSTAFETITRNGEPGYGGLGGIFPAERGKIRACKRLGHADLPYGDRCFTHWLLSKTPLAPAGQNVYLSH